MAAARSEMVFMKHMQALSEAFISSHSLEILAALCVLALVLRALRLRRKGLIRWDEAAYYREAIVLRDALRFFVKRRRDILSLKRNPDPEARTRLKNDFHEAMIYHYVYFKPWLCYLSMPSLLAGRGGRDVVMVLPHLLLGAATLVPVYFAGGLLFGAGGGLMAAALLAVSGWHVWHARSSSAEVGVVFCYATALALCLAHATAAAGGGGAFFLSTAGLGMSAAAGFVAAGAVMFNPMWMVLFPPLFVMNQLLLAALIPGFTWGMAAATTGIMITAGMVCVLLTDLPFIAMARLFPESNFTPHIVQMYRFTDHILRNLRARLNPKTDLGVKLSPWYRYVFYPGIMLQTEGAVFSLAAAVGIVAVWAGFPGLGVLASVHAVFILGLLIFTPQKAARGVMVMLPSMVLCAAGVLCLLPWISRVGVLAIILAAGVVRAVRLSRFTCGVRRAVEFINARGGGGFLCSSRPFVTLYGDHYEKGEPIPGFYTYKELKQQYQGGKCRYLIVDYIINFPNLYHDKAIEIMEQALAPVYRVQDPNVAYRPLQQENEYHHPNLNDPKELSYVARWNRFVENPSREDYFVRVYDLDVFFKSEAPGVAAARDLLDSTLNIQSGDYRAALDLLRKAQRGADGPLVKYYMGVCHRNMNKNKWALRALSEAADALPHDLRDECRALILLIQAEDAMNAQKFEDAEKNFRALLEINPYHAAVRLHLGICLANTGQRDAALEEFKTLLEQDDIPEQLRENCERFVEQLTKGDT